GQRRERKYCASGERGVFIVGHGRFPKIACQMIRPAAQARFLRSGPTYHSFAYEGTAVAPTSHWPAWRNAAAAATGATTAAIKVRAQRIKKGAAKGTAAVSLAPAAETPKIRLGTHRGKINTANKSPPRLRLTVSAAPMAPV